ncbi:hypothetical protein OAV21_01765 [bacterium]|jgi:hypothetical protein|nr:hypothetical protein [bacterium]
MRSRYNPDGSIDYDADRALEILRHADEELARIRRVQQEKHSFGAHPAGSTSMAKPAIVATGMPTITDFLKNPVAELAKPILPDPLTHMNQTKL